MTIVFCLPGRKFGPCYSGNFLLHWSELLMHLLHRGHKIMFSQEYSSNVYFSRTKCLQGNVLDGINQKPFKSIDYDYIMWIDSDISFTVKDFDLLLSHDLDIVAGLYKMEDNKHFAAVEKWDDEYFKRHGHQKFLKPNDLKNRDPLIKVVYTGLGFALIKKNVFETIGYPWFRPKFFDIDKITDFASEDVSLCIHAKEFGFNIYIDSRVIVGHEKTTIL